MECKIVKGASDTHHVQVNDVDAATHFRDALHQLRPLHSVTTRRKPGADPYETRVVSHGTAFEVQDVTLLRAEQRPGPDTYHITLTEGEATVLAEILRNTRGGPSPNANVNAVINQLWGLLPSDSHNKVTVTVGSDRRLYVSGGA